MKDWGLLGEALRGLGRKRVELGADSVKEQMIKKKKKVVKKKKVKNKNKAGVKITTSAEKALEQKAKIRRDVAKRVEAAKRSK